jgi:hypothetical protein
MGLKKISPCHPLYSNDWEGQQKFQNVASTIYFQDKQKIMLAVQP